MQNLRQLFKKAPGIIAKRFKYSKIDPNTDPRALRKAIEMLSMQVFYIKFFPLAHLVSP